jgi:tetratricopeptide (TPR) repeat protein
MFDNATKAFKAIFSKMRYNKSEKEVERDLGPIMDYFEELTVKYTRDDKNEKRLRAAAYYNLARIYQYLDKHDKVIEIGNAIIDSGYDEDDGEDFIKESEELKRKLAFHNMRSRHIVPLNAFQEMDDEGQAEDTTGK